MNPIEDIKKLFKTKTVPFEWMEEYQDIYRIITEDYNVYKSAVWKDLFPDLNKLDRNEIVTVLFESVEDNFVLGISEKLHEFIMRRIWEKYGLSDE